MIFSAYRRDDFADPDTFVLQLGIVLERYPDDVIGELSHPLSGIQRRLKKPPSIADIVEGCEDIMARRPAPARALALEPPVDPAMQARVGELMAGLSKHLHDSQQEAREFALREVAEREAPRKAARIRASWERRGEAPPAAGLITPELADVVRRWQQGDSAE